jgi:menaquinone-dependent protoporphyrinogen IX oxidase
MKIGIVIFSKTGNTDSVARRLKEKLVTQGHNVNIEQIMAINDDQMEEGKVQLRNTPDVSAYDALILGSPVRGFSLSAVMSAYLSHTAALQGIKVYCFVTQFFPFPSMGGKQAIEQMKSKCQVKGAKVCGTGIVNWSNFRREKMISGIVESMNNMF